jgi:hypothetical protein
MAPERKPVVNSAETRRDEIWCSFRYREYR